MHMVKHTYLHAYSDIPSVISLYHILVYVTVDAFTLAIMQLLYEQV